MTAVVRRRWTGLRPVPDGIADSPAMLETLRRLTRESWLEQVADLPGAVPVGEPEITMSGNVLYGCEIVDSAGNPVLDETGRPATDRDRLFMRVSGWVDVPRDVYEASEAEGEARRLAALARHTERQP